jgi:hypothetical protein
LNFNNKWGKKPHKRGNGVVFEVDNIESEEIRK